MPQVTIKTGLMSEDGSEAALSEYQCDWPGRPNVAVHVVGIVRELRICTAVCAEHAAQLASRIPKSL
jgi:hypothetical protein